MKIIDIHAHISLESCRQILLEADRLEISHLCNLVGHLKGISMINATPAHIVAMNNQTMTLVRKHPGRITGFCFLNPLHDRRFLLKEIDRCLVKGNLKGIKLEVDANARSSRLDPILKECARLNLPLLHHAWYKTVGKVFNESTPADIAHLARRHPGVKIIMAHLTAAGIRGILDIQPCPNVFVDTSGSQSFSGIMEYAVEKLGAGRILFGSDISGRDFSVQLGRIHGAKINRREKELILGLNAKKLLGI
ncbi:MAG: amidohydrolase family protein [Verrucomicrobiae bacterium]|nr:amidohydrolase family protein [Verrucomicrobiae bacterium]